MTAIDRRSPAYVTQLAESHRRSAEKKRESQGTPVPPHRHDDFTPHRRPPIDLSGGGFVPSGEPKVSPEQAELEADPVFQSLNPGVQQAVLETINDPAIEAEGKQTLITAVTSEGFARLSTEQAEEFLEYAGNTIPGYGEGIRDQIATFLASDDFQDPGGFLSRYLPDAILQERLLLRISNGGEALPGSTPVGELPPAQREIEVSGPEDIGGYDFESGEVDAERYTFDVDGREVEVVYPKPHPEGVPTPDELKTLVESLPDVASDEYDTIVIQPEPDDTASASTDGEGLVNIFPSSGRSLERLQSTLVHEAAHNVSNVFGEESSIDVGDDLSELSPGWQDWADAVEADGHYVSDYARDSALGDNDDDRRRFGEDFAETVELYFQVKGTPAEAEFARLYPNRYDIIRDTLGDA